MKNCLFFASTLLFITLFHSTSANVLGYELMPEVQPMVNRTKLEDLLLDAKYEIFEMLDHKELFSVAGTNRHFLAIVQDVFKRKHPYQILVIHSWYDALCKFNVEDDVVFTDKPEEIISVLKNFGHLIYRLVVKLDHSFSNDEMVAITNAINLYCADTLQLMDIYNRHMGFFNQMEKPFKRVETLLIQCTFDGEFASSTLMFNEIFPSLRNLSILDIRVKNPNVIAQPFPHLEQLRVIVPSAEFQIPDMFSENDFKELLKLNTQIKSLKMSASTRKSLEIVNEFLPNVESLELIDYSHVRGTFLDPPQNEPMIVFEHLKNLTMVKSFESAPLNVEFRSLLEYRVVSSVGFCIRWADVVEKTPTLEKLYIKAITVDDVLVRRFARARSNLTEMFFEVHTDITDGTTLELVESSQKLEKLHLYAYDRENTFESVAETLQEEFGDRFEINASLSGAKLTVNRLN